MSDTVNMDDGLCPDCATALFHAGPRGGCAINVKCAGCGQCFNFCSPLPSHRIAEQPGVYAEGVNFLTALAAWRPDRERLRESMQRTLGMMQMMGVPRQALIETLEWVLQELRKESH